MAILTVGVGKQYTTITSAIAAAQYNDIINVQAGNYVNDFPSTINQSLTLNGIGGLAHMTATVPIPNGKGFLVIGNDTTFSGIVTIDSFEFSKAAVPDKNGAGIRYQGGTLDISNSYIHNNQEGILGGSDQTLGQITIVDTEFARNGIGDGYTHNIYLEANSLTLNNVYSHDANMGHELKSRCANTNIIYGRYQDQTSDASYCLDFPNGGNVSIVGATIEKGSNAANHTCMIAYGEEGSIQQGSALVVEGNTLINDCTTLHEAIWNNAPGVTALISGNNTWNINTMLAGSGTISNTSALVVEPTLITSNGYTIPPRPSVADILGLCSWLQSFIKGNSSAMALLAAIEAGLHQL